jgi:hypothetical protein
MNAGFGGTMTTKGEMLNVITAVLGMNNLVKAMYAENTIALESEARLRSMLKHLDSRPDAAIYLATITINPSGADAFTIDLRGHNKPEDKPHMDKLVSFVAELLAERTANAMQQVHKLAAQMSDPDAAQGDPDEVPF